jgi:hypothetical protein
MASLMQYMLAVRPQKRHLGLAFYLVRTERNVRVQDIGCVLGLGLILDEEPMTIHRCAHQIVALREGSAVHDDIKLPSFSERSHSEPAVIPVTHVQLTGMAGVTVRVTCWVNARIFPDQRISA